MRRSIFLWAALALVVLPVQAFAAGQCVQQAIADKTGTPLAEIELSEAQNPVFVALEEKLAVGDRVGFRVLVDGELFLSEDLELAASDLVVDTRDFTATPVVELLAALPTRLNALHRLAESGQVEVVVEHNGVAKAGIPWIDLVFQSETLRQGEVAPHAVTSTVRFEAASQPAQKDACTDYCDDEQYDCYLYRCGQFGSASCYDACDDLYLDCLEGCGICQPSSTTTTTYTTVSTTPTSYVECRTDYFFGKGYYRAYDRRIKRTVTTTTTNSDCSQTVTTTVSYFNIYCWVWLYNDPYCYSVGQASPLC